MFAWPITAPQSDIWDSYAAWASTMLEVFAFEER